MPTSVIMERVEWTRGKTVFFERVAQCDLWFPPSEVPLGFGQAGRPPVLVMVSGYSRVITAVMIPSRTTPDLLAGHWRLISGWGRVPKALVWENEGAVGSWRAGGRS